MNGSGYPKLVLGAHVLVGLSVVICATVLAAMHDIDAQAVVAIFGTVVGLIGGSAAAIGSIGAAVNGRSTVPPGTIETALHELARSTPPPGTRGESG